MDAEEDSRQQWPEGCVFDLDAGDATPVFGDAVKTMTKHEVARIELKAKVNMQRKVQDHGSRLLTLR